MKPIKLIASSPSLATFKTGAAHLRCMVDTARFADRCQWDGILIYTDHKQADPWLTAQIIVQNTERLCPLVAVQPLYMHPFALAKAIFTLATFYDRSVYLNMVAGGYPRDLESMGDTLPHDQRYKRLVEYSTIVNGTLRSHAPFTFNGEFYRVQAIPTAPIANDLLPLVMVSGSSLAGFQAAKAIDAVAIQNLRPISEYTKAQFESTLEYGTRLGIIVRESLDAAWSFARATFPPDETRAFARKYATQISDSNWVHELDRCTAAAGNGVYWLGPYKYAYSTSPYLVGTFESVASELVRYLGLGIRTFLIDGPSNAEECERIAEVFKLAIRQVHDGTHLPP